MVAGVAATGDFKIKILGLAAKRACLSRSNSKPWASAHTDQRPGNARASGLRAFSLRAIAGMTDMFRHIGEWRKSRCFALPSLGLRATGLEAAPFSWILITPIHFSKS
ncbi:hypothetical protein A8A01_13595 [Ewingella americana]|nr:hypothetical protein A8A01_13595 [Ewingella americana]